MTTDRNVPDDCRPHGEYAPEASQASIAVEAHTPITEPPNMPNQRTLAWVKSLPAEVQPFALLRGHARIANVVAELWKYPRSCRACLEQLLADEHNQRRFSPEVRGELVSLQHFYKDENLPQR